MSAYRTPEFIAALAKEDSPRHLDADFELVQDTFRRFAEDKVRPAAEHVHRTNADIPEEIISGLAEMGGFGLSVPEEYGGVAAGGAGGPPGVGGGPPGRSPGALGRPGLPTP